MSTATGNPFTSVTSNQDPDTRAWVASFPLETRLALAAAGAAGVGVSDNEDPIFYEIRVDLVGVNSNMATIVGTVHKAVDAELRRYDVGREDRAAIRRQIQASGYGTPGGFYPSLGQVMRWVTVTDGSEDD